MVRTAVIRVTDQAIEPLICRSPQIRPFLTIVRVFKLHLLTKYLLVYLYGGGWRRGVVVS